MSGNTLEDLCACRGCLLLSSGALLLPSLTSHGRLVGFQVACAHLTVGRQVKVRKESLSYNVDDRVHAELITAGCGPGKHGQGKVPQLWAWAHKDYMPWAKESEHTRRLIRGVSHAQWSHHHHGDARLPPVCGGDWEAGKCTVIE